MTGTCHTEEELLAFADGGLEAVEAARVSTHLSSCPSCRKVLSEVARAEGSVQTFPGVPDGRAATPLRRGANLGRYLVLECLGSGGMGVVYTAYDPELDRKVALKLLRVDAAAEVEQSRLVKEARAMARLNHPNVAAVYDVGTFEGRVFVAMELVDGQTLRAWFEKPRTVAEVLEVFLQAGRGLAAAHHAGLVHRDFKPENVMVRESGRASVLDFGLARDGDASDAATVAGTPSYMAPEQREGSAADARTDQYAFCICLHEALFGARPDQLPKRAASVPTSLRRALQRGLSKDPSARFADLDALLEVLASAKAAPARRRALWMGTVGAAVLTAAIAVPRFAAKVDPCPGAEAAAASAWDAGRRAKVLQELQAGGTPAAKALADETVRAFDDYAQAWTRTRRDTCEATRVRGEQSEELLDRRMVCLSSQLGQLSAATALASEPGLSPQGARELVRGLPALSECGDAHALLDRVPPPKDPAVRARIAQVEEHIAQAHALRLAYRLKDAAPKAHAAVEEAQAVGYPPLVAKAFLVLADVQPHIGEAEASEASYWQAVSAAKKGRDARLEAEAWVGLAKTVGDFMRRRADGARLFEVAGAAVGALADPGVLETRRLLAYGFFHQNVGELKDAIALFEQAVARVEQANGASSPEVAPALRYLGDALVQEQQYQRAEQVMRRCIAIGEKDPGLRAKLDIPLASLAEILMRQGKLDDARAQFTRAAELAVSEGGGVMREAFHRKMLGALEQKAGNPAAAEKSYTDALTLLRTLPEPNPYPAEPLTDLGLLHLQQGELLRAETELKEATALFAAHLEADDAESFSARIGLGRVQWRRGDKTASARTLDDVFAALGRQTGTPAAFAAHRFELAQALWEAGRRKPEALALADAALKASDASEQPPIAAWLAERKAKAGQ